MDSTQWYAGVCNATGGNDAGGVSRRRAEIGSSASPAAADSVQSLGGFELSPEKADNAQCHEEGLSALGEGGGGGVATVESLVNFWLVPLLLISSPYVCIGELDRF